MNDFDILELYHGGTVRIENPIVSCGRPDLDFGPGFYLTDIEVVLTYYDKLNLL